MESIKNLATQIRGVSYKPQDLHDSLDDDSVMLLRANNIDDGKINFDEVVFVDKRKVAKEQYLVAGDILICASSGSKQLVGKAASIDFNIPCTFGAFCKVVRPKQGLEKYLGVYFQSNKYRETISSLSIGANINNIRNEHIDSLVIPSYDDESRQSIVNKIETLVNIICQRKTQLSKLDQLIKARFVEMFGIPGNDEKGWGKQPLGQCCEVNPKKSEDTRLFDELEVSFIPMGAVSDKGEIDSSSVRKYSEVKSGFTYFSENDVLFAKITPCMENGKGAIAKDLCNGIGFGTTEFHVLRPLDKLSNPYWLYTLTSFDKFRNEAACNMTGSAGQRRVPANFLFNYSVSLPPFSLQCAFADFVKQIDKSKFSVMKGNALFM